MSSNLGQEPFSSANSQSQIIQIQKILCELYVNQACSRSYRVLEDDLPVKVLSKYNSFALIIIKDQKSKQQKISEKFSNKNILRYYGIGAQIIKDLGIKKMILVSRSKKKVIGLDGYGIKIIKQEIIK